MKKQLLYLAFIALTIGCFSSCKKENVTVTDPAGTITTTMTNFSNVIIYEGVAENTAYEVGANYSHVQLRIGLDYSSLLTVINASPSYDGGVSYSGNYIRDGAEVANIGMVTGLGAVTQKPVSGYTNQATIEVGHGYVIRYKKAFHLNSAGLDYFYARFYVDKFLTSAITGGVNGVVIKYQGPF